MGYLLRPNLEGQIRIFHSKATCAAWIGLFCAGVAFPQTAAVEAKPGEVEQLRGEVKELRSELEQLKALIQSQKGAPASAGTTAPGEKKAEAAVSAAQGAPAEAPKPPPPPTWSVGPIDFSGLVDAYYDVNLNHPASRLNQLRNFDERSDSFSLNMVKLSMSHDADPIGFRVDFGYGRAFTTIHANEPAPSIFQSIEQAYVTLKPLAAKGFALDAGAFVTSAGAEVIETKDNWNYSRSLLFSWAIPYYHMGVRATMPLSKTVTGGLSLTNGWNNIEDNNSAKTVGATLVWAKPKFTLSQNYYGGPEKTNTNEGWRSLYDVTLLLTPNDKFNAYINYDYGREKYITPGSAHWTGIALAAKYAPNSKWAFTPRYEYFNDSGGFSTGTIQKVQEFTVTGEYKWVEGLLSRVEYRRDFSNQYFFERGQTPNATKSQDTFLLGVVAFFGPKR